MPNYGYKVLVEVYDKCKYEADSKVVTEKTYEVNNYEVRTIIDEVLAKEGYTEFDEYHEYLILWLMEDGHRVMLRNSHVDMYLVKTIQK